ncbi:mycothiol synthase [Nocardioides bigeumensis]|jgi:mycothiol synthase|uniref:Mycothiol acetyltransferase n=2 Tax=Nocardioides bigeumensis TaxID=433657 RepID=A0ABN2YFX4_9ACTN
MPDLRAVAEISAAAAATDGVEPLDEATWLALRHPEQHEIDLVVTEHGFAVVLDGSLSVVVRPGSRRQGYAAALLDAVLPRHPGPLDAWSHGNHPGAAALAAHHGFDRVRDLWVMRRPARPAPAPHLPPGVTIRGYHPGDRDQLLRVNAAAFASHPEQGAMDSADLAARMAEPWFDADDLLVAVDPDGVLLGFHWTKVHSREVGEVYVVGVAPEGQGRGLGRLLTAEGLHHLAERGVDEVHLYVESDNAPAIAVYEKAGFTHTPADTHVMYARR